MVLNREQAVLYLMALPEETKVEIKPWKEKRSKQQNAYYWHLLTEVANKMRISKSEAHNLMLNDYGQPVLICGERIYCTIPDTPVAEQLALRSDTFHIKPTTHVWNGSRTYYHIRGSHDYTADEFSILLDGCIQEAKNLGIETLPRHELERMYQEDKRIEERKLQKRDSGQF